MTLHGRAEEYEPQNIDILFNFSVLHFGDAVVILCAICVHAFGDVAVILCTHLNICVHKFRTKQAPGSIVRCAITTFSMSQLVASKIVGVSLHTR